ncbi:MAG: transcription initiation factor IIB [Candidatus Hodarchaeales archaeon]|jgi:transcription initiation factor TFIIB
MPSDFDNEDEKISCSECGSPNVLTDDVRGERICGDCGLVNEARILNTGSEWRAYNREEFNKRARTEAMSFSMQNDLSTYIGFENRDALGQTLSAGTQSQFFRMRKWQMRIRTHSSKDRNLQRATQELDRLSSQLDIPRSVKETAGQLYKKAFQAGVIRGYPIESMIAACVYAGARIRRVPRTLDEIGQGSRITKKRVAQSYRILVTRLNIRIPPSRPKDFLVRMGTELAMSGVCQRFAAEIVEDAEAKKLTIGKDPSGLAAAALYLAGIVRGEKRTQQAIAKTAHVTEVTIRHRHKDLISSLGPSMALKANATAGD